MMLGLVILLASGLYAILGGWWVVALASGVVGIASVIEAWTMSDVVLTVLFVSIAIALGTLIYDFWWHNVSGAMHAHGPALSHFKNLYLTEGLLMVLVMAKMVKAFNGQ